MQICYTYSRIVASSIDLEADVSEGFGSLFESTILYYTNLLTVCLPFLHMIEL